MVPEQLAGHGPKLAGEAADVAGERIKGVVVVVAGQELPGDGHHALRRGHRRPQTRSDTAAGFENRIEAGEFDRGNE